MTSTKPYDIAKRTIWEAYQRVKANRGAAGIDDETIAMFEQDLSKNLYKLWNRMSSGSYFPPPVKQVEIPKATGGIRKLGVPTVSDRGGQTAVKLLIEPILDPLFHADSYGYRPGKSAKQAIAITRQRCWEYDWLVEFDIKAAFDSPGGSAPCAMAFNRRKRLSRIEPSFLPSISVPREQKAVVESVYAI